MHWQVHNISFPFSNYKILSDDASSILCPNPKDGERPNSIFRMAMKRHYTFSGHFFFSQFIQLFIKSYSGWPFQTDGCANPGLCQTFFGPYYLLLAWLDWTDHRCLGFNTYKNFLQSIESSTVLGTMVY